MSSPRSAALSALVLMSWGVAAAERAPVAPRSLAQVRQVTEVESSPDGKTAYFVSDITGALELWSAPAAGGRPSQLTGLSQRVHDLTLSSDGRWAAFASDFDGNETPDIYLVLAAGGETADLTVSTNAEGAPAFSPDGRSLAYLSDSERPWRFQLFVMDLRARKARQLTREPQSLLNSDSGPCAPLWSPDGRTLAVTRSADDRQGSLLLVAADGSSTRVIAPPLKGGIVVPLSWSPDGARLLAAAEDELGFRRLYLLEARSGRGRFIGPRGWDVERAVWREGAGIVFTMNEGGASSLQRMTSPDSPAERLLAARGRIEDFSLDAGGRFALLERSDSAHAPDVWRLDLQDKTLSRVTRSMPAGLEAEELSTGTIISYPSADGLSISAVYLKPRALRLGSPPPLVVDVHGGPDWQSYDDFSALRQALAEAGFAVLAPNYRGSTGFGRKFEDADRKDWGGMDRQDMIAGAAFLAARGDADPKRVGITGLSYGGYATFYALARNRGEWAAGVAVCGMPDLTLDYESATDRFRDWYETMMGDPKTDAALFKERSAVTYLDNMKAPLLIFQGAADTSVPEAEARFIYDRLKALGRDVSLVVYPDEGHGFTRRKNVADELAKTVEFFRSRLAPRP